jgi:hypothetical protein
MPKNGRNPDCPSESGQPLQERFKFPPDFSGTSLDAGIQRINIARRWFTDVGLALVGLVMFPGLPLVMMARSRRVPKSVKWMVAALVVPTFTVEGSVHLLKRLEGWNFNQMLGAVVEDPEVFEAQSRDQHYRGLSVAQDDAFALVLRGFGQGGNIWVSEPSRFVATMSGPQRVVPKSAFGGLTTVALKSVRHRLSVYTPAYDFHLCSTDEDWQSLVSELIRRATVIVADFDNGSSQSLAWEIEETFRLGRGQVLLGWQTMPVDDEGDFNVDDVLRSLAKVSIDVYGLKNLEPYFEATPKALDPHALPFEFPIASSTDELRALIEGLVAGGD